MEDKVEIQWTSNGGIVRGYGRRIEGATVLVDKKFAADAVSKKWAKYVKPAEKVKEK